VQQARREIRRPDVVGVPEHGVHELRRLAAGGRIVQADEVRLPRQRAGSERKDPPGVVEQPVVQRCRQAELVQDHRHDVPAAHDRDGGQRRADRQHVRTPALNRETLGEPVERDAGQQPQGGVQRAKEIDREDQSGQNDAEPQALPGQQQEQRHKRQEVNHDEAVVEDFLKPEAAPVRPGGVQDGLGQVLAARPEYVGQAGEYGHRHPRYQHVLAAARRGRYGRASSAARCSRRGICSRKAWACGESG